MPLKELEVKYTQRRQRPFKLSDGGGLHLLVQPNGSKLWRLKYRFGGKEKLLSFGRYPEVTLAAAREKRKEAKAQLAESVDPGAARAQEPTAKPRPPETFEAIARAWHANRAEGLDDAHASRVLRRMERDAFPAIGDKRITEISAPDVLEMIRVVEGRGALDISRRLKQSTSQVFRFAIASGWATSDPTVHLTGALKPRPRVRHMSKVAQKEFPALVRAIREYDGEADSRRREATRDALEFTLLTWARTSETRFATRDEFEDLDGPEPVWRLSGERMKMDREHLVPLSAEAVAIVQRRLRRTNGDYLFPGEKPGKPISQNTMIFACYRMGYRGRQTVHGFRGLASTWANEAERYKSDWIEMALAHVDENEVRGAYNSALYLAARRRMLQDWADEIRRLTPSAANARAGGDQSSHAHGEAAAPLGLCAGRLPKRVLRQPYWQTEPGVLFSRNR